MLIMRKSILLIMTMAILMSMWTPVWAQSSSELAKEIDSDNFSERQIRAFLNRVSKDARIALATCLKVHVDCGQTEHPAVVRNKQLSLYRNYYPPGTNITIAGQSGVDQLGDGNPSDDNLDR